MAKIYKRLSRKQLIKLADSESSHIQRLVWEVSQARFLVQQIRQLLEHWGDDSWQIITIRDSLIEKLEDQ